MPTNDNAPWFSAATPPAPDPHGHAALLLVESLIHGLLARSLISVGEAIDIVETADSVQIDMAEAADEAGSLMWKSHTLLAAIMESIRHDVDGKPSPLRPA